MTMIQQNGLRTYLVSVLKRKIAHYSHKYLLSSHRSISSGSTTSIKHIVYVSQSKCIFENLALEDWLYEHGDLDSQNYLLMWRNKPAVVIGRHQNAWMECNVKKVLSEQVDLARRKSGGGAVYHDEGNINLSFIKSQQRYCRKENLELVVRAIESQWNVDLTINKREDIILDGLFKISGTASKLGGKRTYHHFTLLLDVDVDKLNTLLQSPMSGVKTRSTESVPANVHNLVQSAPSMNYISLVECIGNHFLLHNKTQGITNIQFLDSVTEEQFPGVSNKIAELQDWEWIFAKTPPFSIRRSFISKCESQTLDLSLKIDIQKGRIHKLEFELVDGEKIPQSIDHYRTYCDQLLGQCLHDRDLILLFEDLKVQTKSQLSDSDVLTLDWILKCMKQCLLVE